MEIMPDGRVAADGDNMFGECDIFSWKDVRKVSCGNWHTAGLLGDGTLVACGSNANGQCDVSDLPCGVMDISCGRYHTAILLETGKVIVKGTLEQEAAEGPSQKRREVPGQYERTAVADWPAVTRILSVFDAVIGVTADGTVLADGYCPCTEKDIGRMAAGMK